jgi:hypothetical protein
MHDHDRIDARSLSMHQRVAERIRAQPELMQRARATLARWRTTVSPAAQPYLQEWERLMDEGLEPCLRMAEEDSARARAMRQASPFAGLLSNAERFAFIRAWREPEQTSAGELERETMRDSMPEPRFETN